MLTVFLAVIGYLAASCRLSSRAASASVHDCCVSRRFRPFPCIPTRPASFFFSLNLLPLLFTGFFFFTEFPCSRVDTGEDAERKRGEPNEEDEEVEVMGVGGGGR